MKKNDHPDEGARKIRKLMTSEEVSDILNVSTRHLSNLTRDGQFPEPLRLGRSVRFRPKDIDQWIDGKWERRNNPGGPNLAG